MQTEQLAMCEHVFDAFEETQRAMTVLNISALDKGLEMWCILDPELKKVPLVAADEARLLQVWERHTIQENHARRRERSEWQDLEFTT